MKSKRLEKRKISRDNLAEKAEANFLSTELNFQNIKHYLEVMEKRLLSIEKKIIYLESLVILNKEKKESK